MQVANSLDVCARSLQFLSWGKDQWDCKIVDHYIAFSLQLENYASVPKYPTIFEWVSNLLLSGYPTIFEWVSNLLLSGYPTFYWVGYPTIFEWVSNHFWVGIQPFLSGCGTKCFEHCSSQKCTLTPKIWLGSPNCFFLWEGGVWHEMMLGQPTSIPLVITTCERLGLVDSIWSSLIMHLELLMEGWVTLHYIIFHLS